MDLNASVVIKRHPDGYHYVPFASDDHPSRPALVAAMIQHLKEGGHTLEHAPDGLSVKLVSGPHSAPGSPGSIHTP